MSQVSYGTITVTDLTDISDVYLEYCMVEAGSTASQVESKTTWTSPERGWGTTYPTWQSGYEIWIRQVKLTERPNGATYVFQTFATTTYSTGAYVRVHGYDINKEYVQQLYSYLIYPSTTLPLVQILNISSNIQFLRVSYPKTGLDNTGIFEGDTPGEGAGLIDVTTNEVGSITNGGSTTTNTSFNHTDYIPICNISYGTPYLDTAVNQINLSIGDINTELQTRLKHFWDNLTSHTHGNNWTKPDYPAGTYTASGIENITFDEEDSDTYGYNTHYANGIKLRYNAINLTTLLHSGLSLYYPIVDNNNIITNSSIGAIFSTNALSFFQPPTISNNTITQGNKTMMLSSNALTFYNPNDGITAYATLNINGLKLAKGGIEAGSAGQSGFIYLSTDNFSGNFPSYYKLTEDISIESGKDYYTYNSENEEYILVNNPDISDIGSYYEYITPSQGTISIDDYTRNDWRQIIGTNFGIRSDGSMYATNVNIVGTVSASEGTIGGFTIRSGELYSLSHNDPYSNESGIYIGTSIMTFGPNGTIWFDDSGKGKVGSWYFNLDELSMISNDTVQSIILSKQGIEIKDTSYSNNYFKISFIDGGGYLSISLSDRILVQEGQLIINANSISINNNQNTYDVLEWITNNHAIAISNQSIINTTLIPFITTYSQYISINTSTPYVYIGTNNFNTDVEIKNGQIDFNVINNNIIHLTSERAQINNEQVENLRMKAQIYTNNSGYLTWIARSNGHLSLKVVK